MFDGQLEEKIEEMHSRINELDRLAEEARDLLRDKENDLIAAYNVLDGLLNERKTG